MAGVITKAIRAGFLFKEHNNGDWVKLYFVLSFLENQGPVLLTFGSAAPSSNALGAIKLLFADVSFLEVF